MRSGFLLAALFVAAPVFAADRTEELTKLRGVWIPVSYEVDGKAEAPPASTIIIADRSWIERGPSGDSAVMIDIDPSRNPKQIDQISGPVALHGIYKLDGNTLTLAIPIPIHGNVSTRRPSVFTTKAGDPFATFVYRRDPAAAMPEKAKWEKDWNSAFVTAKNERQLVLVDYYATWCKPCAYMDATVFALPDVNSRLEEFVLLRVDVDAGNVGTKHKIYAMPTYVIYDPSERERFRLTGMTAPHDFRKALDAARKNAAVVLQASDLLDQKKEIEGGLLLGNMYSRMNMQVEARDAYKAAKAAAEKEKLPAGAQMADALAALTFAREGNPKRAIKLLERLATAPVDRDTEALIWLTMGNAQQLANDPAAALLAYEHALPLAAVGSPAHAEISAAIAQLKR